MNIVFPMMVANRTKGIFMWKSGPWKEDGDKQFREENLFAAQHLQRKGLKNTKFQNQQHHFITLSKPFFY